MIRKSPINLTLEEIKVTYEYFYALCWKKTQIDHIKMWLELTSDFIKKQVGYHEDFPSFFGDLGLSHDHFDKRGNIEFPK